MSIEKLIYDFGEKENIAVGICSADAFEELRETLQNENSLLAGFAEQNIEKRIDPKNTLDSAKSIIVMGMGYGKKENFPRDKKLRAVISQGAVGLDYHIELKKNLESLMELISAEISDFEYKIFVDTGPLVDRAVAIRSGIGFVGRNFSVINKKLGSKMFIGYAITSLDLETYKGGKKYCRGCGVCAKQCPTGAIRQCTFVREKCISYLTQKKGLLEPWEMKAIGSNIYGCDICQNACPENNNTYLREIVDINEIMPEIEEIISLSNKKFEKKYKHTAMGWRGKKIIQRNAICAMGNSKDANALKILEGIIYNDFGLLRNQSVLAVALLGMEEGIEVLEKAEQAIDDEKFRQLAHMSILRLKGEEIWDIGIPEA